MNPQHQPGNAAKQAEASSRCLAIALVAIVVVAFLGSIAGIRFATLDDRWYAAWVWSDSWLQSAYALAAQHGRLLKPSSYTYFLPYLVDSALYRELLRLGTILLCAWLAGNILQRVVRARGVSTLFVLFFFAFAQNSNDHNLFVAYPFAWELSWLTWMAGLLGLMLAIERQSMRFAIAGMLIWLLGLQEGFVPHSAIHVLVAWLAWRTGQRSWRYLMPYLVALAVWIALWFVWRLKHPSGYAGSMLSLDSPWLVVRTMVNYSVGGMPLASVIHGMHVASAADLARELGTLALVKGVAVFAAMWQLSLVASRSAVLSRRPDVLVIALSLLALAFLPNALLAMTPKYQEWMQLGVRAYIYSHYSYYAWTGLGTLAVLVLLKRWHSRWLVVSLATLAACISMVTDASNARVNREQYEFARRWETMDRLFRSEAFQAVPERAMILMNDASVTTSVADDASYWRIVAKAATGKDVVFTPDSAAVSAFPAATYYAHLYDEPETSNQYALLAPVRIVDGRRLAQNVWIYPNTPNRRMHVGGVLHCTGADCIGEIEINGKPAGELFSRPFKLSAETRADGAGVRVVMLTTAAEIDVTSLHVDFARNTLSQAAAVSAVAGAGFEGWNSDGHARWNWSGAVSTLEVRNSLARTLSLQVEFWLVSGDDRIVDVSDEYGMPLASVQVTAAQPGFARFPVHARPGTTALILRSAGSTPAPTGSGQVFQLRDPALRLCSEALCAPPAAPPPMGRVLGFEMDER